MLMTDVVEATAVADESDRATQIEQNFTAMALEEARQGAMPESHPDFDGSHCVACGDEIPAKRLEHGKVRCVMCQEAIERRSKFYRH